MQASDQVRGVKVVKIAPGTAAASSGLRPGDVILSANRQRVGSVEDLQQAAGQSDKRLVLRIKRGNAALYLVLQ